MRVFYRFLTILLVAKFVKGVGKKILSTNIASQRAIGPQGMLWPDPVAVCYGNSQNMCVFVLI